MNSPQAPNPMTAMLMANAMSNQQAQANQQAADATRKGNMIDQSTPYGSLTYTADPNAPGGYSANQSLSAPLQNILNSNENLAQGASNAANSFLNNNAANMTAQSPQYHAQDLNLQNVNPNLQLNNVSGDLSLQNLNPNLQLQNNNSQLDLSYNANAQRLADLNKSTLDPYWNQQQNNFDQEMANRGVVPGSVQYDNAYRDFNTAKSNAYNQADLNAYNTVAGNAATQFNANNNVLNQNNQNALSQFGANNSAIAQNNQNAQNIYGAQYNAANQNNANALNQFNANNSAVNQNNTNALNSQNANIQNFGASLQAYNNPFNNLASLNGQTSVNAPIQSIGLSQTPTASVQSPDVMGAYQSAYGNQQNAYNNQIANNSAMMGGLFGLGGAVAGGLAGGPMGAAMGSGLANAGWGLANSNGYAGPFSSSYSNPRAY